MGIAYGKERARYFDREIEGRTRGQLPDIYVATDCSRRRGAVLPCLFRRDAQDTAKGAYRDSDGWREGGEVAGPQVPQVKCSLIDFPIERTAMRRTERGPSPITRNNLQNIDDKRIARFRPGNFDRSRERVTVLPGTWSGRGKSIGVRHHQGQQLRRCLRQVTGNRAVRDFTRDAALRGFARFENHGVTGLNSQSGRQGSIPRGVNRVGAEVMNAGQVR